MGDRYPVGASLVHMGNRYHVAESLRSHDSLRAREAYRDFLQLWKDAVLDLPIFGQAKAEYAALR
jgi:hypothetical protein